MNKIKKVSVVAVAGLILFGTTVFASTGKVYNTSQGLVLRSEASKTSTPLATIPNDKEVEIVEDLGEWYKVNVDGKEGYLFAEYVSVIKEQPAENQPTEEQPTDNETVENTKPNTTKIETKIYTLPLITSSVIGTIPQNTELQIEKTLNNWAYISYNNINGWIRTYNYNSEIVETPEQTQVVENTETKPDEETAVATTETSENTNLSFTRGYINEASVNVRKGPSTDTEVVTILILNTGVTITAQTDEWYKISYGDYTGYVYKPLISSSPTTSSRGDEVRQPDTSNEEQTSENNDLTITDSDKNVNEVVIPTANASGEKIVSFAKQYLGYRYVYGGTSPSVGFDCSGFIYYIFNSCGYNISRSCTAQASAGIAVTKSELQLGDVVFFNNTSSGAIGHVGIYIGNGTMIHAANSNRGVVTDTINSGYYYTYYYSARRIAY